MKLSISQIIYIVSLLIASFFCGVMIGKTHKQEPLQLEVYKRCLDSDIYNEFQCYNMVIKGE